MLPMVYRNLLQFSKVFPDDLDIQGHSQTNAHKKHTLLWQMTDILPGYQRYLFAWESYRIHTIDSVRANPAALRRVPMLRNFLE